MAAMFDKYKRYRGRKKEHKVAVRLDISMLVKELRGLPTVFKEASLTLERERKVVKFPSRPVANGTAAWEEPTTFVCTIYRDAIRASECDDKYYDLVVRGKLESQKVVVGGRMEFDLAQFAFKGPKQQPLKLSIPVLVDDSGDGTPGICTALLEASVVAQVVQESGQSLTASGNASASVAASSMLSTPAAAANASGNTTADAPGQQHTAAANASENGQAGNGKAATGGRKQRQPPPTHDPTKSATRIANTQKRLKEKAARLAKEAADKLTANSSVPQAHPSDPASESCDKVDIEEALQSGSEQKIDGKVSAKAQCKEPVGKGEAKDLPLTEDIDLDPDTLDIPAVEKEEPKALPASALTGPRLVPHKPKHRHNWEDDDLSELSDSLSDVEPKVAHGAEAIGSMASQQPANSRSTTSTIWEQGWGALLPSKNGSAEEDKGAAGPLRLSLKRASSILAKFGKGAKAAKELPPLQGEDLPYSDSSEADESDADNDAPYPGCDSEEVDAAHMRKIAKAASKLRSQRLSLQASRSAPTAQLISRAETVGASGTLFPEKAGLAEPGENSPPPRQRLNRRDLFASRQKRLDDAHAANRKAAGKSVEEGESKPAGNPESQDRPASSFTHTEDQVVQTIVRDLALSQRDRTARASRLTEEAIKLAVSMEEKQEIFESRMQSSRANLTPPASANEEAPGFNGLLGHVRPTSEAKQDNLSGSQSAYQRTAVGNLDAARDQRKIKELQIELRLAEERIAFLEGNDGSQPSLASQLRRSFHKDPLLRTASKASSSEGEEIGEVNIFARSLTSSREQKLSEEVQQTRLCLLEIQDKAGEAGVSVKSREELAVAIKRAIDHAAAAKELAELLKQDVLASATAVHREAGLRSGPFADLRGTDKTSTASSAAFRQTSGGTAHSTQEKKKPALQSRDEGRQSVRGTLDLEAELARAKTEVSALHAKCQESERRLAAGNTEKEELQSRLEAVKLGDGSSLKALERELAQVKLEKQTREKAAASVFEILQPILPAQQDPDSPQHLRRQLRLLVSQHKALILESKQWADSKLVVPDSGKVAELERTVEAKDCTIAELQRELELMTRESGEGATSMAVAVAVAPKESEIAHLQRQLYDLEQQAHNELGDMHEELLEMRQACHSLELALTESEAKCAKMLAEKQQMEQQLQETAGELIEAERELTRHSPAAPRRAHEKKLHGEAFAAERNEDLAVGPDTPPALRPSRATEDPEAGHIVITGGGLIAHENLRKDFDAMTQELVQKKLELAELSEDYERVCHAFLKADEPRNGPVLANLRREGGLMRVSHLP